MTVKRPNLNWQDEHANAILSYQALNERVGDRDALIWQSAALAMTAQAFLLTIALGHDTSPAARSLAAMLGIAVTVMSVQLMLKHRLFMATDELLMIALERHMGLLVSAVDHPEKMDFIRADGGVPVLIQKAPAKNWILIPKSVHVWIIGLSLFALVNLLLLAFSIPDALGVPCPWTTKLPSGSTECVIAL
ncbi:hypothetical protein SRABI83_03554 [Arthrobacter sp. Bi83]|uniref:hypothetical protein n=1 Tax=Arthrobacter sp. Bi83 TaxID=2822353 RepID=UPI001D9F4576|nr:hypothetical protein [Arthrobacter sp. Bi83]CAH0267514.1 hypothetical protein SRABI83_03554 [Arthrobacter sp. Bi83]